MRGGYLLREDGKEHCYAEGEEDGAGEVVQFKEEGVEADDFARGCGERIGVGGGGGGGGVVGGGGMPPEEEEEGEEGEDGDGSCGEEVGEGGFAAFLGHVGLAGGGSCSVVCWGGDG